MHSIIDLSYRATLPEFLDVIYPEVAEHIRESFNDLIDQLGHENRESLSYWLASAELRNPTVCRLFHDLIFVTMVKDAKIFPHPCRILIDNPYLVSTLGQSDSLRKRGIILVRKHSQLIYALRKVRRYFYGVHSVIRFLVELTLIRLASSCPSVIYEQDLTLIDTFAIQGFITEDRYYTGLYDSLDTAEKKKVRFVPQFSDLNFWKLFKASKLLNKRSDKFFVKEAFIRWRDVISILRLKNETKRLKVNNVRFKNFDVSNLLERELQSVERVHGVLRGALNYYFVANLKRNEWNIGKAVCWFENQSIDKGWSKGFTEYFPEIDTVGYQGFVAGPMSVRPLSIEALAGAVPKYIGVMGKGFIDDCLEFDANILKTQIVPAFRFSWIDSPQRQLSKFNADQFITILIVLPGDKRICDRVISILRDLDGGLENGVFLIKTHPRVSFGSLISRNQTLFTDVSSKMMGELFQRAHVVISTEMTSAGYEAALRGLPVIVVSPDSCSRDLMPQGMPSTLWYLARTTDQIKHAYKKIINLYNQEFSFVSQAEVAREHCLAKVTEKSVRKLLF